MQQNQPGQRTQIVRFERSFLYYPRYVIWLEVSVQILMAMLQWARIFLGAHRSASHVPRHRLVVSFHFSTAIYI
ncbi:hypothetical protein SO694_001180100 [Aureococcus anophagefferens]|uniref:Uncharacterized protein n=1 Tax=Aureococcus anophagefferens TaxID=44056 RepID=A0ABR1FW79_AURAN